VTAIDASPPRAGRREWAGLAVLSLAAMMVTFDLLAMLLALPGLSADLRPSTVEQLWILDIYGFLVGGFLIPMGSLGDRIGRRRLLQIGAVAFAVASLLSAYATSPAMLIAGRALLGIAGATLSPSTLALLSNMFRDRTQLGQAIGIWASAFALGAILGPVVGGFLLAHFWWGSVFLLAVPVMVLLLVLIPILVPEFKNPNAGRLDLVSAVLSVAGMLGIIYCIKEMSRHGADPLAIVVGLAGIALGILFVLRQRRLADPMLDLAIFRTRSFSTMLVGLLLYGLVSASAMLFITQYFQSVAGLSPLKAALCLLPGMVLTTAGSTVAPLIARRIRPAYLIGCGLVGVLVAYALFSLVQPDSGPAPLIILFAVMVMCQAPMVSLGTGFVVASAPPEKAGQSSALVQIGNETGAALGVALLGSIGAIVYRSQLADSLPTGLPAGAADGARENVATAVTEASSLPEPAHTGLLDAAHAAFTTSLNVYGLISAGIVLAVAAIVFVTLRHIPATGSQSSAEAAPAEETEAPEATEEAA
jgi:MFS transporter, DHA2 family, multidrug resistance protein